MCGGAAVLRYPRGRTIVDGTRAASSRVCELRFLQLPCLVALQRR